jgi:hypothetical protein
VSTYEADYRDAAPFVRKRIREELLNAAIVLEAGPIDARVTPTGIEILAATRRTMIYRA